MLFFVLFFFKKKGTFLYKDAGHDLCQNHEKDSTKNKHTPIRDGRKGCCGGVFHANGHVLFLGLLELGVVRFNVFLYQKDRGVTHGVSRVKDKRSRKKLIVLFRCGLSLRMNSILFQF